mmetsp:Transcript_4204/g.10025  ORF Transcript_4204/g.10025 Transcript_4204/m.10025 type:complete len:105 (+) Transcript_4204:111-425(+)
MSESAAPETPSSRECPCCFEEESSFEEGREMLCILLCNHKICTNCFRGLQRKAMFDFCQGTVGRGGCEGGVQCVKCQNQVQAARSRQYVYSAVSGSAGWVRIHA